MFAVEGRFEEDFGGLFKGAFSQRSRVNSVDSMTRNRCENTSLRHNIAQSTQMSVIDIDTIGTENHSQLTDQAQPNRFNSQDLQHFINGVSSSPSCINARHSEDLSQGDAIGFEKHVSLVLDQLAGLGFEDVGFALVSEGGVRHLGDLGETAENDVV